MPLYNRAVLAVKPDQFGEGGEPNVPSNVELLLVVPDDPEVMDVLFPVEEREHHGSWLAATLSYQVCSWSIDSLQSLAGYHPAQGTMVPPAMEEISHQ